MPRAIELMRRREEEILRALKHLSEKTDKFTSPRLLLIGGYALRAFTSFARFTRDCDFALKKGDGWTMDRLRDMLPKGFSIERLERRGSHGYMRCVKLVRHGKARVKVSLDFMEGEIRGRAPKDIILIDDSMVEGMRAAIPVAGKYVDVLVPRYVDYLVMKVVSARPLDIRDLASLILDQGLPRNLPVRIKQILPYPEIFRSKLEEKIIPVVKRKTFLDSWRGLFGTTKYTEKERRRVVESLETLLKELQE